MTSYDDSAPRARAQTSDDTSPDPRNREAADASPHTSDSAEETQPEPRLGTLAPVDPRGRHELLRLAAGLAPLLHGPTGVAISQAIAAQGVEPAHVERVVSGIKDAGVIALIDGTLFALGRLTFLEGIGIRPRLAELRVAERIERTGDSAYFVVAVARAHCLGVFGAPGDTWRADSSPAR